MAHRCLLLQFALLAVIKSSAQCTASFSQVVNWDTVSFTNLSSLANARYYWNFGDGSTSYETAPVHVFIEAGTFQVTLHALDTGNQCHSVHQEWMSISRPFDGTCEPYMTDSFFIYNGTDYVQITDEATGCDGMNRYIDCMGAQNFPPGNWHNLSSWEKALTMARLRYVSNDSINGYMFRRAYYRTIPYNQDPDASYDTCSADFEYVIDYQPDGAVGTFKTLGPPGADTIWVTGYGNPIPLVGQTSTFTFPYYGGPSGHWKNIWRRNYDPNYGCQDFQAHTLIIKDPYYVEPPSCLIEPQPVDAMIYQNGTAQFFISSQPGSEKRWEQNAGLGWAELFDAGPYSGVHTDTLSIANCQNWWTNYQYRCIVTAPGSSCHNTSTVAALTVLVGIEDTSRELCSLYPNPATDHLRFQWNTGVRGNLIRICDALGTIVRTLPMSGDKMDVDVADLSPGLYYLGALCEGREVRSRFIKQ